MKMLYCNCIYQKLSFKYCANISSLILIILQESKGAKKNVFQYQWFLLRKNLPPRFKMHSYGKLVWVHCLKKKYNA